MDAVFETLVGKTEVSKLNFERDSRSKYRSRLRKMAKVQLRAYPNGEDENGNEVNTGFDLSGFAFPYSDRL